METTPSSPLIDSRRVEGTRVHGPDGTPVGTIGHLMIDKLSGRVVYAILHFGGVFGMGEESFPIPWEKLDYDPDRQGFVTSVTAEEIQAAPRAGREDWHEDRSYEAELLRHWGTAPYWL